MSNLLALAIRTKLSSIRASSRNCRPQFGITSFLPRRRTGHPSEAVRGRSVFKHPAVAVVEAAAIMEIAIRPSPLLTHANTMAARGITKAAIASIRKPHVFERGGIAALLVLPRYRSHLFHPHLKTLLRLEDRSPLTLLGFDQIVHWLPVF